MTKQEVNKLLALMKANYSFAFKGMSQQDKYLLLNTWAFTLQDISADVVMIAAMQLISTSKWLPTVAEIRKQCKKLYAESAFFDEITPYWLADIGCEVSQAEIDEYNRERRARDYIASATNHLRGDGCSEELKLDTILQNPAFANLGAGESGFSMLDEVEYELPDGNEEDE